MPRPMSAVHRPTPDGPRPVAPPAAGPRPLLARRTAVLLALACGLLVLLCAGRPWVEVTGLDGRASSTSASGGDAAPVATAMAVVVLAGALALTTARRLSGLLIGVLLVLAGAVVAASAAGVGMEPGAAAARAASAVTGTTSATGAAAVTAWPWVAAAGGALAALTGLGVLASVGRWRRGRRYEAPNGEVAEGSSGVARRRHVDEMDAWDALSRGNDPT